MAVYTAQVFPHAGAAVGYTQPATGSGTGNTAPCGPGLGLLVKNASAGSINVTIAIPAAFTFDGIAIATPQTFAVAAGADIIIPLATSRYADPTTSLASWGVSANTSVTAAVVQIAP